MKMPGADVSARNCEHCGADNVTTGRFCRRCGRALADPLVRSATRLTPLMELWRGLNMQMTRKELRRRLGEPLRIDAVQAEEKWTYEYEAVGAPEKRVRGEVTIAAPEGRVTGWTEPDWASLTGA